MATITRTGRDPFGEFLHDALRGFNVDDRWVTPVDDLPTPVTFCEIFPPDDFPLYFYRFPKAPDLEIHDRRARPRGDPRGEDLLGHGHRPLAGAVPLGHARRARGAERRASPCSTSTTGRCSGTRARRRGAGSARRCAHADVAVGNQDEWETAAATRGRAVDLMIRKRGPRGVLALRGGEHVEVPPAPVEVVNGLGAGDAFGGALCHGLLADWDLERMMRFCNAAGAIVAGAARLRRRDAHRARGRGQARGVGQCLRALPAPRQHRRRRASRPVITPESAGWGFSGLRVVELARRAHVSRRGDDELIVLPLSGSARDGRRRALRARRPRRRVRGASRTSSTCRGTRAWRSTWTTAVASHCRPRAPIAVSSRATSPPRTSRSSCAAPARRAARSTTSARRRPSRPTG